jgi:CYTH domain-containing protein
MPPLEIERKYLLKSMPELPGTAREFRMEQGYFADGPGRLRRTTAPGGTVTHTHTVKTGQGLVREEVEREITREQFDADWPRTEGRRLAKTRTCVPDGELVWEIDAYDALDLVLAEVELPSPDAEVVIPDWLAPHVVREVTDEPAYQNYELAIGASRK